MEFPHSRTSLRSKISLRFTLLVGLTLLATGICSIVIARKTIEERISLELRATVDERTRAIQTLLEERTALAQYFAKEPDIVAAVEQRRTGELRAALLRKREALPGLSQLLVLNTDGRVLLATDSRQEDGGWGETILFERGMEKTFVGAFAPAEGQRTHIVSTPIGSAQGETIGVLFLEYSLDPAYHLLQWENALGKAGGYLLVDTTVQPQVCLRADTIVFSAYSPLTERFRRKKDVIDVLTRSSEISPLAGAATPLCSLAATGYEGVFSGMLPEGGDVIAAHRLIPEAGIGIIAYLDRREVFRPIGLLLATLIGTTAVLFLLVAFISMRLSHEVIDPILHLRRSLEQLDTGHWSHEVSIHTGDELEILDREVARLAERLREAYFSLEERVQSRTEELAEAHSRDEALLESIAEGFLAVDMSGKVMTCNRAAERMLLWRREEILGAHVGSCLSLRTTDGRLLAPSEHPVELALREKKTIRSIPQRTELCERKDGASFPISLTVMPFLIGMEMKGVVITFRDISEEKRIDRMKSEFISLASHQLRTPLTAIGWYVELLEKEAHDLLQEDQRDYIAQIIDSHHRMVTLVNALLNVSRIELGRLKIDPEETDVLKLVNDTVKELTPQIEQKKLHFVTRLPEAAQVSIDPRLVEIVLSNLLSNAIKYTPNGGTVEFALMMGPDEMRFDVRDTGYGIPKHQQQHIFEKLFRADNVQKTDTVGTGLGLYIAKFSVEAWGGRIWFESEEGHGTTFSFTVPRVMKKIDSAQKTIEYDALTV